MIARARPRLSRAAAWWPPASTRDVCPAVRIARLATSLLGLACLLAASSASAQTGQQVLIVVNGTAPASAQIGEYYARARGVPAEQIIKLTLPARDEISRAEFTALIERPITAWLTARGAADRILYLVLAKGVPLRIAGTGGLEGTMASVDSELTLLYRKLAGAAVAVEGRVENPYYLGVRPTDAAKPFSHETHDIFLVTRLDGYTVADVTGVIDRGRAPVARGSFVLDMRWAVREHANPWLQAAADRLGALGFADRVILEKTGRVITHQRDLLGYYSWGSNDTSIRQRDFGFTFVPGALAGMFVSTDGRTFTEPPASWRIGAWESPQTYFAGSPQSLAGDLIRAGVTGIAGHVAEPYLDATIRPEILFPAYASGFNLVEAYYLAMPYLSWQTVIVGDPLCAPFPRQTLSALQLDPPVDPETELPRYLSARRLAAERAQVPGLSLDAIRLAMRGERQLARGDRASAQQALEQATALEPAYVPAQHLLAQLYETTFAYDKAVGRYRQIVTVAPNDVAALNNLAFGLGVRQGQPALGREPAERAYALSKGAPLIADTLGWILHLLGDHDDALRYLQQAVSGLPTHAEVRWHYAVVLAAAGRAAQASQELLRALELDAGLKSRPEVTALQKMLRGRAPR